MTQDDRNAKVRRGGKAKRKARRGLARFLPGKGGRVTTAFMAFATVAAVGVPLNALFLQEGRHPAPLFQAHAPVAAPDAKLASTAPLPPQRPAAIAPAKAPAAAKPESAKSEAAHAVEKPNDQIGLLLDSGVTKSIPPKASGPKASGAKSPVMKTTIAKDVKAASKPEPAVANVMLAQRALVRLGYVLHADGVFGGTTRQAIEKFERDNGMPARGDLTPKILRQLAGRSGLKAQ
jgi:hypothetical protein